MPGQTSQTNSAKQQKVHPYKIDPKTGKRTGNGHYTYQNSKAYDQHAVKLLAEDPTQSIYQIGKKLKDSGKAVSKNRIYERLKRSDYLRTEFARIEKYHMEQLHRDTYPLAAKRMNKALKNKELDDNKVFPYVKLAYDKVHGETHKHVPAPTISVGNIEKMQVIINNDLDTTLNSTKKEG